jgi:hypothetical protein
VLSASTLMWISWLVRGPWELQLYDLQSTLILLGVTEMLGMKSLLHLDRSFDDQSILTLLQMHLRVLVMFLAPGLVVNLSVP